MSWILGLSTSSPRGSAALVRGEEIGALVSYDAGAAHAERLLGAVDGALERAGIARAEIAAVACDVGPGSFTGVRVALSTAQGIALGLGCPAVGVGSLEAMALAARRAAGPRAALALLDARRGEVFAALFDAAGDVLEAPRHLPVGEVPALAARASAEGALVIGPVAVELGLLAAGDPLAAILPDAGCVALLAQRRLAGATACDPASIEAAYVRAPDARTLAEQGRPLRPTPGAIDPEGG